jgi:hypothetical protein
MQLDSAPTHGVTVGLASSDSTEGVTSSSITFGTGNWDITQTVTVTGVDDEVVDYDASYQIATGSAMTSYTNMVKYVADVNVVNIDGTWEVMLDGHYSAETVQRNESCESLRNIHQCNYPNAYTQTSHIIPPSFRFPGGFDWQHVSVSTRST